ncbi:hypothetical protein CC2G_008613 [Coprinopsis cinerea AmutBmut pab1-1]|nr:hypothetical protein CC2G_008613 [Coprinopsis cinerea AmutBmut pab1-1]
MIRLLPMDGLELDYNDLRVADSEGLAVIQSLSPENFNLTLFTQPDFIPPRICTPRRRSRTPLAKESPTTLFSFGKL